MDKLLFVFLIIRPLLSSRVERASNRARPDKDGDLSVPQNRAVMNVGITPEGRLLERYNTTIVVENYGITMGRLVEAMAVHDAKYADSLPNTNAGIQTQVCRNEIVPVPPSALLSRSLQSVLYRVATVEKPLVIKYQANCLQLDFELDFIQKNYSPYIHPAIVESLLSTHSAKFGLAPKVYFVSPPTTLCKTNEGNCYFLMGPNFLESCAKNPNASLRYILMDHVEGQNLHDFKRMFKNATVPIHKALMIGEQLIAMVEQLHLEAHVIHGDIHALNIMINESADDGTVTLKFVEFGSATVFGRKSELILRKPFWVTHSLFSPWEILGYTSSARDDIARAVDVFARLMFPLEYEEDETRSATAGGDAILRWKLGTNFFNYSNYDPLSELTGMSEGEKFDVRFYLDLLAHLVQQMESINTLPPYAEIRSALEVAREIVAPFA